VREAIKWFESQGAKIVDISLPNTALAVPVYYVVAPAEASSNLSRFDGVRYGHRAKDYADINDMYRRTRAEGFGAEVKRRILVGTYVLSHGYYDAYYLQAQKVRRLIARDFTEAFARCDLIIGPTSPSTAFPLGAKSDDPVQMYLNDIFTIPRRSRACPACRSPAASIRRACRSDCRSWATTSPRRGCWAPRTATSRRPTGICALPRDAAMKWLAMFLLVFSVKALSQERSETWELLGHMGGRAALLQLYLSPQPDGSARITGEYLLLPTMQRRFLEGERSKQLGVTFMKEGNTPILYGRPPLRRCRARGRAACSRAAATVPKGSRASSSSSAKASRRWMPIARTCAARSAKGAIPRRSLSAWKAASSSISNGARRWRRATTPAR
jgi:hypothetical protein